MSLALAHVPVPAYYVSDETTDYAIWRPSTSVWHVLGSNSGQNHQPFGARGDIPIFFSGITGGVVDIPPAA